jgi:hypothetical protein
MNSTSVAGMGVMAGSSGFGIGALACRNEKCGNPRGTGSEFCAVCGEYEEQLRILSAVKPEAVLMETEYRLVHRAMTERIGAIPPDDRLVMSEAFIKVAGILATMVDWEKKL